MKDLSKIFFNLYLVYSFSYFWRGIAFLCRINTRVCIKLLPQYQTAQKCAVPTKPIFHHLEQVKVAFWGWGGDSTITLDGVCHFKTTVMEIRTLQSAIRMDHYERLPGQKQAKREMQNFCRL